MAKSKWEEVKDKLVLIEGWARDGLTDEQIAKNLGLGIRTFYEYKEKHPQFSQSLKKGKEIADYEVENALFKTALEGNTTAQIFWLKNRKPSKWREKQEVQHSGNINNPFADLSTEELRQLMKDE